jgi:hypothetical protein
MQSLQERLQNSINEAADKNMKLAFGKTIRFSGEVVKKLEKLGLNWMHEYDTFVVYEDGRIEYRNRYFFTLPFSGKVRKGWLNRVIPANDDKVLKLDTHVGHCGSDIQTPYHLFRAVLNAFPLGFVNVQGQDLVLQDIDYTKGDFEKDKEE